jgi:hypothetical protein
LSYKENVFLFEFASLDFASPNNNQYAYMMAGFDEDWNYTDAGRRDCDVHEYDQRGVCFSGEGIK